MGGYGTAREIVSAQGSLGFVVAGFWLREEDVDQETAKRIENTSRMLSKFVKFVHSPPEAQSGASRS